MGITTNNNHRLLLSTLADKYNNFFVIADEVYQLLYFDEDNFPKLRVIFAIIFYLPLSTLDLTIVFPPGGIEGVNFLFLIDRYQKGQSFT